MNDFTEFVESEPDGFYPESDSTFPRVAESHDFQVSHEALEAGNTGTAATSWEQCDSCDTTNAGNLRPCDSVIADGDTAVRLALPQCKVQSDQAFRVAVFNLARHLKAVDTLRDRPAGELKTWVFQWRELAADKLSGRSQTDCYAEFVSAWKGVRHAIGDDIVNRVWERIQNEPLPLESETYDDPRIGLVISLCWELQRENGGNCFFLSNRKLAELLRVTQPTAGKWLNLLVADCILEVIDIGGGFKDGHRMARTYRILDYWRACP